jgi:HEAT repeat protein
VPIANPIILASLGLLGLMALVVLAKRVLRGLAERRSRSRRARWLAAVADGPDEALRAAELRGLARAARRSLAAQDDLLALLEAGQLPPPGARARTFAKAIRSSGLERAVLGSLGARRATSRGRAALLAARLRLPGGERRIARLLRDRDPDVRAAATWATALAGTPAAVWVLLHALRRGLVESERVVERLATREAAGPVLDALELEAFQPVRGWLAEALGLTGHPGAVPALNALMDDRDEEVRIRASRALGRIASPGGFDALIRALRDPSDAVRAQAARALGAVGDDAAVSPLLKALGDPSWWVRARAAEALVALGDLGRAALRSSAAAHPDRYARDRAVEALAAEGAS